MPLDINDLPAYDNPPPGERVRGLLGSDDKGQMQIIAPEQALVDPEPIRQSTSRNLRSVPAAEDVGVSAIPGVYGLPTVVHSALKARPLLALATEIPGHYVRASGAELSRMCASHASFEAEFCETLRTTPADTAHDHDDILRAVETFTTRRIEARLDETLHIPPLPETARRIISLQQETSYDLEDLVQIVEADPAVAARIMGWANSAFYGNNTPSKSINDAIMRVLGFDMVFNMALGMAIGASLGLPKSHVSGTSPYWLDAVYNAATMEALARHCNSDTRLDKGTAYLIGLLANFGTLVVGHVFPPQYDTICRLQEANPQLPVTSIDQHVLMVNREVIAATLLELWDMPDEITTTLRYQYVRDYAGPHRTYVRLQQLAHDLLQLGPDNLTQVHLDEAHDLGIDETGLLEVGGVVRNSQQELGELANSMMQ